MEEARWHERVETLIGLSIGLRARFRLARRLDGSKRASTRLVRQAWEIAVAIENVHARAHPDFVFVVMEEYRLLKGTIYAMESAIGVPPYVLKEWRDVYCGVK